MAPNFDAFAWLHALVVLAFAAIGLVVLVATGLAEFRGRQAYAAKQRRRGITRLWNDALELARKRRAESHAGLEA